jgi:hypothetical protein
MRRALLSGALSLALGGAAVAAEIHGTVSEAGKPVASGTKVQLACGGATASVKTDEFGSYSLKISATGECRLTVETKGASPSISVTVYEKPSRYDLVVAEEGGRPVLRRK